MARVEKTVFISYRRTNAPWTLAIYQNLNNNGYDVFFDFNGIASGDFEGVILGNIRARAHFLVLLTPSALERCNEPGDWLRREIQTALSTKRNIVPLMLEGFDFGTPAIANQLTGKLAALKKYNALDVPASYFMAAMERLREKFLNVPLEGVLHPASPSAQRVTKRQQAAADTAPAVKEKELTAQQWFERGFDTKDLDEKIRFYSQAIHLKPDYAEAFNNRGVARKDKSDFEDALQDYNQAIRLNPKSARPFNNRANLRKNKGDLGGALEDYNEAIRLKPDYADLFSNRGVTRFEKGDIEGALQDYGEAIRLKPDFAQAFNNRANARGASGDIKGALQDYNEAIRLNPNYANAFYNRGNLLRETGELEAALQDFDEAIRLNPNEADVFYNRALIYQNKDNYEAAIADFQKYLDLGGGMRDGDQAEVEQKIRGLRKKLAASQGIER
jgi:tetratricopeptide (TPR) repeat protein